MGKKIPRLPAVERVVAHRARRRCLGGVVHHAGGGAGGVRLHRRRGHRGVLDAGHRVRAGLGFHRIGSRRGRCRDILAAGSRRQHALTFAPDADGRIVDMETGSRWDIFGRAISGPLEGSTFDPGAGAHRPAVVLVGSVPPLYGGVPRNAVGADDYPPPTDAVRSNPHTSRARSSAYAAPRPAAPPPAYPPPGRWIFPACARWSAPPTSARRCAPSADGSDPGCTAGRSRRRR